VFVASVTQRAKGVYHITLSSVARLALPYFSTLSHKRQDEKKLLNLKFVSRFSAQILFEIFSHFKEKPTTYYHKCT